MDARKSNSAIFLISADSENHIVGSPLSANNLTPRSSDWLPLHNDGAFGLKWIVHACENSGSTVSLSIWNGIIHPQMWSIMQLSRAPRSAI